MAGWTTTNLIVRVDLLHHHSKFLVCPFQIDPKLSFHAAKGLPQMPGTLPHDLHFNVAFTNRYFHLLNRAVSPHYDSCGNVEDMQLLFWNSLGYVTDRTNLINTLKVASHDLVTLQLLFGPWYSQMDLDGPQEPWHSFEGYKSIGAIFSAQ